MKQSLGFCVLAAILGLAGCAVTKSGYVEKGNRLFEAGKYSEAALNYRKALQKDPQFGEAHYRMGLVALKQDDARTAYQELTRAVDLLPANTDAREKLASLTLSYYLLDSRRPKNLYNQLIQLSGALLANNPKSFQGWLVKAYLSLTDRKPEEAEGFFRKALESKQDPVAETALAQVLLQNGKPQEAERIGLEVIGKSKSYAAAYDLLYKLYSSSQRLNDAEKILETKIANNPKESAYRVQLAGFYADHQKTVDEARTLQELLDRPKDFPQAHIEVGDFYESRRNFAEATRYYEEGIRANTPDKLRCQQRLVALLLNEKKNEEAAQLMDQILKEHPNEPATLRLRASLWIDSGQPAKLDLAIHDLQALLKQSPDDRFLFYKLGQADRRKGDLDGAVAEFLQAIKDRVDVLPPRYELAQIALERGQGKQAVQYAGEVLAVAPNDNTARLLHAMGLIATREYDAARGELTSLAKDNPKSPQVQLQLGLVQLAQKNYSQSTQIFEKLRQDGALNPMATAALASTYSSEKQYDKATQILEEGVRKFPDSTAIRAELALVELQTGKYDSAIKELQQVVAADPKSLKAWLALAEAYDLRGDLNLSISTYQKARDLFPKDPVPAISLASALEKAGRLEDAKAQYEAVLQSDPNNVSALNNFAFLLSGQAGSLDEAMKLAQRAIQVAPEQPGLLDTLGYIYLKRNMVDSALRTFTVLAQKYPTHSTFRYHLGLALLAQGEKAKAVTEFKAALANHPSPQEQAKITELLQSKS